MSNCGRRVVKVSGWAFLSKAPEYGSLSGIGDLQRASTRDHARTCMTGR